MKDLSNTRGPIASYDLFEIGSQTRDDSTYENKGRKALFLRKIRLNISQAFAKQS